jgi:hypothetical protein
MILKKAKAQGQVKTVVTFILLTAVLTSAKAYCQQDKDQQINTIAGTITFVDVPGDTISVETKEGTMVFGIAVESELFRFAHHMASIEIKKGDPVIVQYESSLFGKNTITRLVDERPDSS